VECVSKGKAHKRCELGCKVGIATTSKDNFIVGALSLRGKPFDGHTLMAAMEQAGRLGDFTIKSIFVDR